MFVCGLVGVALVNESSWTNIDVFGFAILKFSQEPSLNKITQILENFNPSPLSSRMPLPLSPCGKVVSVGHSEALLCSFLYTGVYSGYTSSGNLRNSCFAHA